MLRFAVVGMGTRGNLFAQTLKQSYYAELVAVADVDKGRAEEAGAKYGAKSFQDYKEMIDKCGLDGIVVTTPDPTHRGPVVYAAEHKVNILCEKPFATTEADAAAMVEAIQKNGVSCLVAFESRWSPPSYAIKERIDAGDIGEVLFVDARLSTSIRVPTKFLSWSGSSTPAWYMYPHILDLATWYSGQKVKRVYATGVKKKMKSLNYDTYDTIHAVFNLTNDVTAQLMSSWVLPEALPMRNDFKVDVFGERGGLRMDTSNQMVKEMHGNTYEHLKIVAHHIYGRMLAPASHMLHYFIDCLREGREIVCNEMAGYENTRAIEAVHRSVVTGEPIDL